jgi:antitoxin component of MazEF toxin-antitoxin module
MTLIVKDSSEDTIFLPAWLMRILNLSDGSEVKAIVEGQSLRLARLDQFLALRGAYADDIAFDNAINSLEQAWTQWTLPNSA